MMQERLAPPALLFTQIGEIDVAVLSQATTTTCIPAICAEAGLVPCAELGIRQISRWPSLRLVIMANRQQTSIFTLRAGVRLHADGVIAGQFHQPVGKLGDHLLIPFRLLDRAERVQLGEFRP